MRLYLSLTLLSISVLLFAGEISKPTNAETKKQEVTNEHFLLLPWYMERLYTATPPMKTELIEGKVIVTEILHETLVRQGLKVGMEITEINGMNVVMYADKYIRPYTNYTSSDEMVSQVYSKYLLSGYINENLILKMVDGEVFQVSRNVSDPSIQSDQRNTKIIIEKVE